MTHRSRATRIHAWWWYSASEMLRNDSRPAAARLTPDAIVPPADLITLSRIEQIEALSRVYLQTVGRAWQAPFGDEADALSDAYARAVGER